MLVRALPCFNVKLLNILKLKLVLSYKIVSLKFSEVNTHMCLLLALFEVVSKNFKAILRAFPFSDMSRVNSG
jgi:hypothetical protein